MYRLQEIDPAQNWQQIPALHQFYDDLATHPYCSDSKGYCHIRSKSHAIKHAYIQPNHPAVCKWLAFDIDDPQALFAYHDNGLPPPQIIIKNPANGHAHYCYKLTTPVGIGGRSSVKAMRYLASVQNALRQALGADSGYSGNLIKNPCHKEHETYIVNGVQSSYTLAELANYLDLEPQTEQMAVNDAGYGRNCSLFDELRHIAYKLPDKSYNSIISELDGIADVINNRFDVPLPYNEVKHIIRSIARYCERTSFGTSKSFSERQRARVTKRWGDNTAKREQAEKWHSEGIKKTVIAERLGVTTKTLTRWGLRKKK